MIRQGKSFIVHNPSSPHNPSSIAHDTHINVPTVLLANIPEKFLLMGAIFKAITHQKAIINPDLIDLLTHRHDIARKEELWRATTLKDLRRQRRQAKHRKKGTRKELEARIATLETRPPQKGMQIEVLCAPVGSERQKSSHIILTLEHLIDQSFLDAHTLSVLGISIRHGKITLDLKLKQHLEQKLRQLEVDQELSHCFRALPGAYSTLYGLAYTHHIAHGLEPGALYYARKNRSGELLNPKLVLQACGLGGDDQEAGRTMRLQIELLEHMSLSGEHAEIFFDDLPLVTVGEARFAANALPDGVRSGTWATISLPDVLWAMQSTHFAQVPRSLLQSRLLYDVNLGLFLCAERAYKSKQELDKGLVLEIGLLMAQAGLRQPFRRPTSRDRSIFAQRLARLEEFGLVVRITTTTQESLESEEIEHKTASVQTPSTPEQPCAVTPAHPSRRSFRSVLAHRKIHIHLYQRVLVQKPPQSASPMQQALPSG